MKVVRYDPEKKAQLLAEALVVLLSGGTIVYPTETAYGLGANFFSPHACRQVFIIKYRPFSQHLPVIVPSLHYATTIVKFSPRAMELASRYWPGPLTLVLPFLYRKEWPHHGDDYLAVRISSHPFAANLARAFGRPIIATSANISDQPVCYSIDEVLEQFKKARKLPDLVIDVGELPKIPPSTIVKEEPGGFTILREGGIRLD